jgi:hypothetical protein
MKRLPSRSLLAGVALAGACLAHSAWAQPAGVEAKADTVLRAMTTYMAGLKRFSLRTENSLEVVTAEGQKIQFVAPAALTVSRPNKLMAERRGDIVDQAFFYDGKTLTLFNPGTRHYATVPAPDTIDAMLEFATNKLDVIAPGTDLIDTRAYDKLMQDVKSGVYVGMAVIGGQRCHHLAYRGAEVDWQLWVREGAQPLPCRYVITSKGIAGAPQFTLQVVNVNTKPVIAADKFRFVPPKGARAVEFLPPTPAR